MNKTFTHRLHIVSIMLDGTPWVQAQFPQINRLTDHGIDWHWTIVEGVAKPVKDTAWVADIPPRLSQDGSHQFVAELAEHHPRISHIYNDSWQGKVEMFNQALHHYGLFVRPRNRTMPVILLEVDVDECWQGIQMANLTRLFDQFPHKSHAYFKCRYFVGPNLVITSDDTYGNHRSYEWIRAWRCWDGMIFTCHEPPRYGGQTPDFALLRQDTEPLGFVFDHYAYATEKQIAFKETYYKYPGAVKGWRRLQRDGKNPELKFPVLLKDYFPWVTDNATVDRLP